MPDDNFGIKERAAMLGLMAAAREISNYELKELVGFTLDGKERRKLNERKLVETDVSVRPFVHLLTEKGWSWCADELAAPTPKGAGSAGRALYALLAGLRRYLDRSDLQLADVFQPAPETDVVPREPNSDVGPKAPEADVETRIRTAYRSLAKEPNGWVSLTELRPLLGKTATSAVDKALTRMNRSPRVTIVPETNQKALRKEDRDAAVRIGGEDKHLLSIEET